MKYGTGWLRDYPDFRDYTPNHPKMQPLLKKTDLLDENQKLPTSIDLRKYCSPIDNQGTIGSCTAHAGTGIYEYFQKKVFGKYVHLSRLFLYKVTRKMLHLKGDTGAFTVPG